MKGVLAHEVHRIRMAIAISVVVGACGSSRTESSRAIGKSRDGGVTSADNLAPNPVKDGGIRGSTRACGQERELAPGLLWQSFPAPTASPVRGGTPCIRMVRADLTEYRLQLFTALVHGGSRTAPEWAAEHDLVAVINASMYHSDRKSTGLMVAGEEVNNPRDNPKFGAFFAYDPIAPNLPAAAMYGRGCPEFDLARVRKRYRVVVQNYRLFDCDGEPIVWKDEKIYSSAVIAIDSEGRAVFIHLRAPYLMRDVTKMLAAPELGLSTAMFVEGGPEASLYVKTGEAEYELAGSYETDFNENDDNSSSWKIPNVIGLSRR